MDNNKGQTIFLSVIGIATLLVAIIGATFAWFSVTVQGNDDASSVIVTTAVLGTVQFTDGNEIDLELIVPESQDTKTFTVANTESDVTTNFDYYVYLNVIENTLTPVADGQFVHTLTHTGTTNGATQFADIPESVVPATVGDNYLGHGILVGTDTHTYTYNIHFKDNQSNQNNAQGKTFAGKIVVKKEAPQP